jgi:hypothetical protein
MTIPTIPTAILKHAPAALELGFALLRAVQGDRKAALKAIRQAELEARVRRDERMSKRR